MDIFLLVTYLLIALVFSFMCSVFEAVLLSVRQPYIAGQKEEKPKNAKTWDSLLADINRPLSAILILNTVAHTVGAAGVGAQAMKIFGDAPLTTGIISATLTLLSSFYRRSSQKLLELFFGSNWHLLPELCSQPLPRSCLH